MTSGIVASPGTSITWSKVAATVSGLLGRLERRGLVRRQPSATDHRAKQILLTDEGAELLQRLDTVGTELWARVAGELTEAEVSQLVALTSRIWLTVLEVVPGLVGLAASHVRTRTRHA